MKYYQPFGEVDTNASYSNGNAMAGIKGSIPDARAIEHPMREIINVLSAAGVTPAEGTLTQLRDAIITLIVANAPQIADALRFIGGISCAANPNYPAADAGYVYKVTAAGKIGGAGGPNVEVGDVLTCHVDNSAAGTHAAVGNNWMIQQANIDGAYYQSGPDVAVADGGTGAGTKSGARTNLGIGQHLTPGGRLTLTTGTPVTSVDVIAASTLYYTPMQHDVIWLYSGTEWVPYNFTELSLALSGLTSGLPYDVFVYDNAGALTLELTAFTNATTRATALVRQNGILVKNAALNKRYLGTIIPTAANTTEDSYKKRYVWNYYNRTVRTMGLTDAASSWTYSTAAWRIANNNSANKLEFVVGVTEDAASFITASALFNSTATGRTIFTGVGVNTVSTAQGWGGGIQAGSLTVGSVTSASFNPGVGYNYASWMEYGGGTDVQTWQGGGARGITGSILA